MQSYADTKVAVGFQRKHEGMMSAFKKIYAIRGIRGLYRGVIGKMILSKMSDFSRFLYG